MPEPNRDPAPNSPTARRRRRGASDSGSAGDSVKQRPWWREMATLIALVGLTATLAYNGYQISQSVAQQRFQARQASVTAAEATRTRIESEFGTLTALMTYLQPMQVSLAMQEAEDLCNRVGPIPASDKRTILAALEGYNYLAWLFRQPTWKLTAARDHWRVPMAKLYVLAQELFDFGQVDRDFQELEALVTTMPEARTRYSCSRLAPVPAGRARRR